MLGWFCYAKNNFIFEVIVHDDASTDKTADIIREYQKNIWKSLSQFFKKLINTRKELMSAN